MKKKCRIWQDFESITVDMQLNSAKRCCEELSGAEFLFVSFLEAITVYIYLCCIWKCGFNNVEFYYGWNYCGGLFVVLNSGFGHKIENME